MSASHAIQAASIFYLLGQPFGDRFCTIYQLLLVVLATFFYIGLFSNHYFLDLAYLTPSSRLWGKPCTVSSTSHSPSLLEPVPIQPPLTWSHCVSFRLHYSPACNSSPLSTSSTFSPRTFFLIFHISFQDKDKGEVFHIKSYFSLSSFAGMQTHRHSVLKGPWQLPFPVLAGLKVLVYKVKFVIRTFLPGGNYHQEAVIISSDHTMPHHGWRIFSKLSPLQFSGPRQNFPSSNIVRAARGVPGDHGHSIVVTFSLF